MDKYRIQKAYARLISRLSDEGLIRYQYGKYGAEFVKRKIALFKQHKARVAEEYNFEMGIENDNSSGKN